MWVVTDTLEESKLEENRQGECTQEVSTQEESKQGLLGSRKAWGECTQVQEGMECKWEWRECKELWECN